MLLLLGALCQTLVAQPVGGSRDSVLAVRFLDASEEALFSPHDALPSPFWASCDNCDSLVLTVDDNCVVGQCGFDAHRDASVTIKMAGGARGLYALLRVTDDSWAQAPDPLPGDFLTMAFDTMDSDALYDCIDCRLMLYSATLTYTSKEFTSYMLLDDRYGFAYSSTSLLNAWNPVKVVWGDTGIGGCLGVQAETWIESSTVRASEYRIPWLVFPLRDIPREGCPIPYGSDGMVPTAGSRRAFLPYYFDFDVGDTASGQLAWLGGNTYVNDANYWGDLVFGPGFPAVPTPVESLLAVQPSAWQLRRSGSTAYLATSEAFTLTGRRVGSANAVCPAKSTGVAVVRYGGATELVVRGGDR